MLDIVISGLLLSGTYALVALGLNLQYGVSRIMNLANGEMLVLGALAAFWMFTVGKLNPYLTMVLAAPLAFAGNWLIYRFLLRPLVSRSKNQGQLEVDSILATFGMSFILIGIMISIEGGFFAYKYLSIPIEVLGTKASLSRIVAFAVACCIGLALYLWLNRSRTGMAVRLTTTMEMPYAVQGAAKGAAIDMSFACYDDPSHLHRRRCAVLDSLPLRLACTRFQQLSWSISMTVSMCFCQFSPAPLAPCTQQPAPLAWLSDELCTAFFAVEPLSRTWNHDGPTLEGQFIRVKRCQLPLAPANVLPLYAMQGMTATLGLVAHWVLPPRVASVITWLICYVTLSRVPSLAQLVSIGLSDEIR